MSGKIKSIDGKKELQAVKERLELQLSMAKDDNKNHNLTKKLELLKK